MDNDQEVIRQLKSPLSRAQMLKAAAVGLGAAAIPGAAAAAGTAPGVSFPFFPVTTGTYTTETLSTIVTNLLTFEYLTEAYLYYSFNRLDKSKVSAAGIAGIEAELAIKQYHIDFLSTLMPGAAPLTTSFTIPASLPTLAARITSAVKPADVGIQIEEILATVGGSLYQTAARGFAELGQPTLVEYAYQIGGQYYEFRGILRTIEAEHGESEDIPPNTRAFEADRLLYTQQLIDALKKDGVIGGTGTPFAYPGRDAILAAAAPVVSKITVTKPVTPA